MICVSRRAALGCGGLLLALVVAGMLTSGRWLPLLGAWLAIPARSAPADAIVVLEGGGPQRMLPAIQLYHQGIAPELWITGDAPIPELPSRTQGPFARAFAEERGIPSEAIRLLKSTSTWEDAEQIAALAMQEGVDELVIVTSWYHSRRARCVIEQHLAGTGVRTHYELAPTSRFGPADWWRHEDGLIAVSNELLKLGFYWWQYGMAPWKCL